MVLCNANVIIEYGKRMSRHSNAPAAMEYDNNRTEESTAIALVALYIQHNPYIFTIHEQDVIVSTCQDSVR